MFSVDLNSIRLSADIENTAIDFKLGCQQSSSLTQVLNSENYLRNS